MSDGTVNVSGSEMYEYLDLTGNDNAITFSGTLSTLNVVGADDSLDVTGSGAFATISDGTIEIDTEDSITLDGNGNMITEQFDSAITMTGTGNTVDMTANADTVNLVGDATGDTLIGSEDGGSTVTLATGSHVTFEGAGDTSDIGVLGGSAPQLSIGGDWDGAQMTVDSPSGGSDTQLDFDNFSGATLEFLGWSDHGEDVTISGSRNSLIVGDDVTLSATGSGDSLSVVGDGDVATLSGAQVVFDHSNPNTSFDGQLTLNGTGNTINLAIYDTLASSGNGNVFDITGEFCAITASGSGDVLNTGATGDNVTMSDGTVNVSGYELYEYLDLTGTGDAITFSGTRSTLNVEGADDSLDVTGSGAFATISDGTIEIDAGDGITLGGTQDTVALDGTGDTLALEANSSATATGSDASFTEAANDSLSLTGTGDTVTLNSTGDRLALGESSSATLDASAAGDSVTLSGNDTLTLDGSAASNTAVTVTGSEADDVVRNWQTGGSEVQFFNPQAGILEQISTYTGANGTGTDTENIFDETNGTSQVQQFTGLASGVSEMISDYSGTDGTGTLVTDLQDNTNGTSVETFFTGQEAGVSSASEYFSSLNGTGTVTEDLFDETDGRSQVQLFTGLPSNVSDEVLNYSSLNGSGGLLDETYNWKSGGSEVVFFNPGGGLSSAAETFTGANHQGFMTSLTAVETNGDTLVEDFDSNGSYDAALYGPSGSEIGWADYNSSGELIDGSGGGGYAKDGGGYYSGGGGYYGFAGKASVSGVDIGSIAAADLAAGNVAGAIAAEKSLDEVRDVIALDTQSAVLSGSKWDSQVVTWSAASMGGSSAITAEVAQAFAVWSAATGIQFEEVENPSQAEVNVGFTDFNTASSGVVGYTTIQAQNGQIQSAAIQLEDLNETPLAANANGQLFYSGTDTSFEQDILHEIGHALGFADNADPTSIMDYAVTGGGQTLDANDLAGIKALYGTGSASDGTVIMVNQLVAAMAAFSADEGGASMSSFSVASTQPSLSILATAHH